MTLPTVLPFDLEWSEAFIERREYLTAIFQAENGAEQRQQLRARARRIWRFRVWGDLADAARLDAVLETGRAADIAAPFWPHQTMTSGTATAAGTSIPVVTTGFDFRAGQYVLLRIDTDTYELAQIATVGASTLTTVAPLVGTWAAGTPILPCFAGRINDARRLARWTPGVTVADVEFAVNPLAVPAGGSASADLAMIPLPAAYVGDPVDTVAVGVRRLDSRTGDWSETARWAESATSMGYPLQMTAAEVATLWSWYDRVLGALGAVWVPSWHDALTLAAPVADDATAFVVAASDYTALQFPRVSRRQLAIVGADGAVSRRLITASVDNGDGTETLTTDLAPFRALTPGLDMLAQLRTMRLTDDAVEVAWLAPDYAEATLAFTELSAGGLADISEGGTGLTLGGEATPQASTAVVVCVWDAGAWTTIAQYGGSFTFVACDSGTMEGLWSLGIGDGNGQLTALRTFHALDPAALYRFTVTCQITASGGTPDDFFSLRSDLHGTHISAPTGVFFNFGAGGVQVLALDVQPTATGDLGIKVGATGIEFADGVYRMTMTAIGFTLLGPA